MRPHYRATKNCLISALAIFPIPLVIIADLFTNNQPNLSSFVN